MGRRSRSTRSKNLSRERRPGEEESRAGERRFDEEESRADPKKKNHGLKETRIREEGVQESKQWNLSLKNSSST